MWSNISAPKSALKAAKVGQQQRPAVKLEQNDQDEPMEQQENQSEPLTNLTANHHHHHHQLSALHQSAEGSPLMRYKHAVCSSPNSGFIYVHGGRFANGMPLDDDVWRFDAHENSWLQLRTGGCRPPSLQEHTLSEHRDHLYLFGGQVSAASGQEHFFWRLDLAKRQWASLGSKAAGNCSALKFGARLGPTNRRGHTACVYRDSIYIFGGYEDFRGSSNQLWQYDLLNERWELRNLSSSSACHPEPRHNHSAVIYQDDMYIYGGLSNLKPLGDLWRWSWRDKRWFRERTRGQSPGQLHGHSAVQAFGSMFVFGGERQSGRTTCSLWRLNLSNLCWKKIKARGPRPNPTTWHAAIANPLGILDEANYLIEGDVAGSGEFEHEHQQQQQQTEPEPSPMEAQSPRQQQQQQSMSDNHTRTTMQQRDSNEQTPPMLFIRPTMPTSDSNHLQLLATNAKHSRGRLKASKSSCDQMSQLAKQAAGAQPRPNAVRTKRKLRLSFLRRSRKQVGSGAGGSGEVRQLPISKSAASISTNSLKQLPPSLCNSKSNLMDTDANGDLIGVPQTANQVAMELDERHPEDKHGGVSESNLAILDTLDTDIKQMFQRAMSPIGRERAATEEACDEGMTRDSVTQSSLAPTLTQTYQTAREHLSSQSTLTITLNEQQRQPQLQQQVRKPIAAGHELQRKQLPVRRTEAESGPRRGRPKSEIVQSLIDRADARIKDACMPLFNPEVIHPQQQQQQQLRSRFGSNELSILGELANHRMFERPKRHTIHQTMTYYNLYFADERHRDNSSSGGGDDSSISPPGSSESASAAAAAAAARRRTERRQSGSQGEGNQNTSNSLSAALVGVRDGGSSSGDGDLSQKTSTTLGGEGGVGGGSRLESEVASLMASSDSRTLCNELGAEQARSNLSHRGNGGHQYADQLGECDLDQDELEIDEGGDAKQCNRTSNNSAADNTSLSFSVIAEFEEDDILQYSSPTEMSTADTARSRIESPQTNGQRAEGEEQAAENGARGRGAVEADDDDNDNLKASRGGLALAAQKSASSGYESIQSGNQWSNGRRQASAANDSELSPVSKRETDGGSVGARPALSTTSASSTTAESLALTTTNDTNSEFGPPTPASRSLPSSPPDSERTRSSLAHQAHQRQRQQQQQQQQQPPPPRHSNSFASSLMSGPSRLFGKRRIKTRYWQLCMFVIGGKQQGGQHNTGNLNEPITIWRLYI